MVPRAVRCPACRRSVPGDVLAAVGDACPYCQRPLDPSAERERVIARTLEPAQAIKRGRARDARFGGLMPIDSFAPGAVNGEVALLVLDRGIRAKQDGAKGVTRGHRLLVGPRAVQRADHG